MNKKVIAVDFDGTIVIKNDDVMMNSFVLLPNVKEVLSWMAEHFYLILWTCRDGESLRLAINCLSENSIYFDIINENIPSLDFETSRKIFADEYIDDRNVHTEIDWIKIQKYLEDKYLCTCTRDEDMVQSVIKTIIIEE